MAQSKYIFKLRVAIFLRRCPVQKKYPSQPVGRRKPRRKSIKSAKLCVNLTLDLHDSHNRSSEGSSIPISWSRSFQADWFLICMNCMFCMIQLMLQGESRILCTVQDKLPGLDSNCAYPLQHLITLGTRLSTQVIQMMIYFEIHDLDDQGGLDGLDGLDDLDDLCLLYTSPSPRDQA